MVTDKTMSICGTKCDECHFYGDLCKGCNDSKGQVFYIKDNGVCRIYECCKKAYNNCSECKNVPCNKWLETRDPNFSDEEFKKSIEERLNNLNEDNKNE